MKKGKKTENKQKDGVFERPDGSFGFRFGVVVNGRKVWRRRYLDDNGQPLRTRSQASKARQRALQDIIDNAGIEARRRDLIARAAVPSASEVWRLYRADGVAGKAPGTIRKHAAVWEHHVRPRFGSRRLDEISPQEVSDYLAGKYYNDGYSFSYTESILKVFYLIYGQAYSRGLISVDLYNRTCADKRSKIHMPLKTDDDSDVVVFDRQEMAALDNYFTGTNAETAFLIGKYCGLRIAEAYGLLWEDVDFSAGVLRVNKQMQYIDGRFMLRRTKTRAAVREVLMPAALTDHLARRHEAVMLSQKENPDAWAMARRAAGPGGDLISAAGFVNVTTNPPCLQTINSMKYHSRQIKEKLGLEFKYHYLRHTYASRCAEAGIPPHLLCRQLGHRSARTTQQYYLGLTDNGVVLMRDILNRL